MCYIFKHRNLLQFFKHRSQLNSIDRFLSFTSEKSLNLRITESTRKYGRQLVSVSASMPFQTARHARRSRLKSWGPWYTHIPNFRRNNRTIRSWVLGI